MIEINDTNIDSWLFDYFENELSALEKAEVDTFIQKNPQFQDDFDAWNNARLSSDVPPLLSSEYKASLVRKSPSLFSKYRIGLGIGVIASIFFGFQMGKNIESAHQEDVSLLKEKKQTMLPVPRVYKIKEKKKQNYKVASVETEIGNTISTDISESCSDTIMNEISIVDNDAFISVSDVATNEISTLHTDQILVSQTERPMAETVEINEISKPQVLSKPPRKRRKLTFREKRIYWKETRGNQPNIVQLESDLF